MEQESERELLAALTALKDGDFSKRLAADAPGIGREIARTLNETFEMLAAFASEQLRITRELGVDGRLGGTAEVIGASGEWQRMLDSLNTLCHGLTNQLRRTSQVAAALSRGQRPAKTTAANIAGEVLDLRDNVNALVDLMPAGAR